MSARSRTARSAALAALALTVSIANPVAAQGSAPFYTAELIQPVAAMQIIAGGVVFRCEGTRCVAPKGGERPLRVCNELRAKTPVLVNFTYGGAPLAEDKLARCNA